MESQFPRPHIAAAIHKSMRFPNLKTRRYWIAIGTVVPALTVLFLISGFFQWSPLNCWHDDVDINTGRVRYTRYLFFCLVSDRTEDTWLSHAHNDSNGAPDWRRVNTFSPGLGHSPHYRFHGAIYQINTLERADSMISFDPAARRKVADTLLKLWQHGGSGFDADQFVEYVAQAAFAMHKKGASVFKASDVPVG